MHILETIVNFIMSVGAVALLPFMITALGIYFRIKPFQAFKNGITIGIGLLGINTILGLLTSGLGPITEYYSAMNKGYQIIDIGWQGVSAMAWATPFAVTVVPLGFVINFLLVRRKKVKTLNVDIWNYWYFLLAGATLYLVLMMAGVSKPMAIVFGTIYALVVMVVVLKVADFIAPTWQEYFGLPGTTCTTTYQITTAYPIVRIVDRIFDKIPGLNKIDISVGSMQKKFGALSDTAVVSFFVGILLCIMTHQDVATALTSSVSIAAGVVLLPKMVSLLMDGLVPIGEAAQEFMTKKLGEDADIYIGMDCALGLGDPCALETALFIIPITVLLALIFPVKYFPLAGLGSMVYNTAICAWATRGNMLRTLVGCTVLNLFDFWLLSTIPELCTMLVASSGTMQLDPGMVVTGSMNSMPVMVVELISKLFGIW